MENFVNVVPLWQWWGIWNAFKSFFNQVSSWDFSILKWVLIVLPILFIIFIIYCFVRGWVRVIDDWTFWDWYWIRTITWYYWTWKTKNTFQGAYLWKQNNPDWVLISNLDYDFTDFYFNSKRDLGWVLKDLVKYIYDTNNSEDLKKNFDFPPIRLVVDEAHLYFFARKFKDFTDDALLVLTQCRKRELWIDFITQELWQLDIFIRRVSPFIQVFEDWPLWTTRESIQYCINPECTSIRDKDSFEEEEFCYLLPSDIWKKLKPSLAWFYAQKYMTKKVIWKWDFYATTESEDLECSYRYEEFKKFMDKKITDYRTPLPPKKTIFDNLFKKDDDLQQKIIEEQKKKIDELIKLIPDDVLKDFYINNDSEQNVENSVEMSVENSTLTSTDTGNILNP